MFIDGIAISNYRSFGSSLQYLGPLNKINLIIGQNNAGKSNILSFLKNHLSHMLLSARGGREIASKDFSRLDQHIGERTGSLSFAVSLNLDNNYIELLASHLQKTFDERNRQNLHKILHSNTLSKGTNLAWFKYEADTGKPLTLAPHLLNEIKSEGVLNEKEWHRIYLFLTERGQENIDNLWISHTLQKISPINSLVVDVSFIPAIRRIEQNKSQDGEFGGAGIIDKLAKLQNPNVEQQSYKQYFQNINEFLRIVTGNQSATLEIPYERNTILVHMDNKTLPLVSLGTGIHEVIIIAAAATTLHEQIVCIEEPELHLHPTLQKKLIWYLQTYTKNQYFITSHSAHLLDTTDASIFHIRLENGQSKIELAYTPSQRSSICVDLGYRPSDLLQSNCIIWVEGPSDRIYINHWVRAFDSTLYEGIHYSIMFYGGRLLCHLSATDPEVEEFISLRRLNRQIAIVIDSDRTKAQDELNATKSRIAKEFDSTSGFVWITQGREIENYVPFTLIEEAVRASHNNVAQLKHSNKYEHVLYYKSTDGKPKTDTDKVKVARHIARQPANLDVFDLRANIQKMVEFIRNANGL